MRQTLTSTQGSHRDLVEILFRSFQSAFFQANRGVIRRVYQSGSGTLSGIRTRIHDELMRLRAFQFSRRDTSSRVVECKECMLDCNDVMASNTTSNDDFGRSG